MRGSSATASPASMSVILLEWSMSLLSRLMCDINILLDGD